MSRLETISDFSILSEESTSKPEVNFKHKDKSNIINVVPDLKKKNYMNCNFSPVILLLFVIY